MGLCCEPADLPPSLPPYLCPSHPIPSHSAPLRTNASLVRIPLFTRVHHRLVIANPHHILSAWHRSTLSLLPSAVPACLPTCPPATTAGELPPSGLLRDPACLPPAVGSVRSAVSGNATGEAT
ncbi:hypothetical protein K431DRAFT_63733 [Polychaeton citri CBS 116435]|uniref:Uncharacterized protein n=1 Tax=Polychaeton citri CBS 116435 TaxID=1314669 RepID=A0A9P4UMY7_9PEZI|nr:hypothetical protein K431DRAFT_63733 [Polychaeton citri CBS 116435]